MSKTKKSGKMPKCLPQSGATLGDALEIAEELLEMLADDLEATEPYATGEIRTLRDAASYVALFDSERK